MKTISFEVHDQTYAELEILLGELKAHGKGFEVPADTVEELVRHVVATVTEGSARPGSWERQLLYPMGLIPADSELLNYYRHEGSRDIPDQPPI